MEGGKNFLGGLSILTCPGYSVLSMSGRTRESWSETLARKTAETSVVWVREKNLEISATVVVELPLEYW